MSPAYEERFYRRWVTGTDLVRFEVGQQETDLAIAAEADLSDVAGEAVGRLRDALTEYIGRHPAFLSSFEPVDLLSEPPEIARRMAEAVRSYGVGPMAAVAGAIAEGVGRVLLERSPQVIVENGGDLFVKAHKPLRVSLYSGPESPFSEGLGLKVDTSAGPLGVCTSSGTVGHSTSFGKADAVVAIADSAARADAAATAIANTIGSADDVAAALEREKERGLLRGLLVDVGDKLGAWGEVELT